MRINVEFVHMKLHYFLFNGGSACMLPFIPVMAKAMGYSTAVVAVIYTFLPIMGMIAKPIFGSIADKFKIQKLVLIFCIALTTIFLFGIPRLPALPSQANGYVHCDSDTELKLSSSQVNNCLKGRLNAYLYNDTMKCQMSCTANSSVLNNVCNYWGIPNCNSTFKEASRNVTFTDSTHNLTFTGVLRKDKFEIMGNDLYLRLQEVIFPGINPIAPVCKSLEEMFCTLQCDDPLIDDLFLNPSISDSETPKLPQFWFFLLFVVLGWVGQAGAVNLGDAICFELLGDSPSKYGYQRLWGSIGWGTFSFLAGVAVDSFSSGQLKNYDSAAWMLLALLCLNILVVANLKFQQASTSSNILRDVGGILSEVRILVYLVWAILVGMGTALVWNFLLWHLEDLAQKYGCETYAWVKTLEGFVMAIQCFGGELPFFFLSGYILKKIGHVHCMTLVLATLGVRFLLYSFLVNPWLCIPIEFMNGITFGLFYATMASYASIIAPPGTEATMQGLVGAIFEGVGVSLGSLIGGLVFNHYGGSKMFQVFGIGALITAVIHAIVQYFLSRKFSIIQFHERDFKQTQYTRPQDAIHMLQDTHNSVSNIPT